MAKLRIAIGKAIKRFCPECNQNTSMIVIETAGGWEVWTCERCNHEQRFKTK